MRRRLALMIGWLIGLGFVTAAWAGSPHFITLTVTRVDTALEVDGKEAGLGNETQVHIVLGATASCINPGGNHPKAENKQNVSAEGDFPVQNGKALFTLTLVPIFQPDCSPPMMVIFTDVTVSDAEHGLTVRFPGTL